MRDKKIPRTAGGPYRASMWDTCTWNTVIITHFGAKGKGAAGN